MSWSQVDFENQTLTINQQLQREKQKGGKYIIRSYTKNDKPRIIRPPAICFEYLKAERVKQAQAQLLACDLWNNPDNLVFTNDFGRYLIMTTFYKHFKNCAEQINRPDLRPHDLRHTAGTVAVASGSDVKSVQQFLGHASASFTLDVYAHASERMKEDNAKRMETYFNALINL